MADETTGPEDRSKNISTATPPVTPVPSVSAGDAARDTEPKILEETVVRKAAPEKPAPGAPAPAVIPAPDPVPPPAPSPPKMEPVVVPHVQKSAAIGNDIAQILKGVKLPERRDTPLSEKKPIENKAAVFDTALGATVAPATDAPPAAEASASAPSPVNAPQEAEKVPNKIPSVHTLKDDLHQVVQDQKISIVRAASLEQDRRARGEPARFDAPTAPQHSKRTAWVLFASAVLFILGAGAIFGVYTVMQNSSAAAPQTPASSSILFAESAVTFPLDNQTPDDLKRALANARASMQGSLGSITEIIPTVATTSAGGSVGTRPATFAEFMAAIGASPPDELIRALGSNFFFGIHTVDINAPLLVIPVTSYDHAFAGMLAWEATMNSDLAPVFTAVPAMMTGPNGLPVSRTFVDDVKQNYDVRELKDDAGNVVLYYSFPTQSILVIAESPYSFAEILSRLQAQREL